MAALTESVAASAAPRAALSTRRWRLSTGGPERRTLLTVGARTLPGANARAEAVYDVRASIFGVASLPICRGQGAFVALRSVLEETQGNHLSRPRLSIILPVWMEHLDVTLLSSPAF